MPEEAASLDATERLLTCDLPRLRGHLSPEVTAWAEEGGTAMSDHYGLLPEGQRRVTDAERDCAVKALTEAHADGRLPQDLFEARMAAAVAAQSEADLAVLGGDLGTPAACTQRHYNDVDVRVEYRMCEERRGWRMAFWLLAGFACWVPFLASRLSWDLYWGSRNGASAPGNLWPGITILGTIVCAAGFLLAVLRHPSSDAYDSKLRAKGRIL